MVANFPGDIPHGTIKHLFWHSDNASHFKSCGAQNFFTTQMANQGGPSENMYVYSFGAPHHGKGVQDRVGRMMEHAVDQAGSSSETTYLQYTDSKRIQTLKDVYD